MAYAMWVSTDFYLMVINAFIFMRNDAIVRERVAVKQADEANANLSIAAPKADIFDGRLTNGGSVPWNWACKSLGLAPMKLKEGLKRSGKFVQKWNLTVTPTSFDLRRRRSVLDYSSLSQSWVKTHGR